MARTSKLGTPGNTKLGANWGIAPARRRAVPPVTPATARPGPGCAWRIPRCAPSGRAAGIGGRRRKDRSRSGRRRPQSHLLLMRVAVLGQRQEARQAGGFGIGELPPEILIPNGEDLRRAAGDGLDVDTGFRAHTADQLHQGLDMLRGRGALWARRKGRRSLATSVRTIGDPIAAARRTASRRFLGSREAVGRGALWSR
jgi:hypothetical protein